MARHLDWRMAVMFRYPNFHVVAFAHFLQTVDRFSMELQGCTRKFVLEVGIYGTLLTIGTQSH
jgi:hypothetical protein